MQTEENTDTQPLLVIERQFDVPVAKLFAAFTSAEDLKIWWWPKGLYADHVDLDFRVGGKYFINMKGFDQSGGGMTGQFEVIVKNERLIMTDSFADKEGNPISASEAGMEGDWPSEILITFDFYSVDENRSGFRLEQNGIPTPMQKDCIQGWNESFDKLASHLNWP